MGGQAHAWMDFTNVRIAKSDIKKNKCTYNSHVEWIIRMKSKFDTNL